MNNKLSLYSNFCTLKYCLLQIKNKNKKVKKRETLNNRNNINRNTVLLQMIIK